jgi:hypothetical protein
MTSWVSKLLQMIALLSSVAKSTQLAAGRRIHAIRLAMVFTDCCYLVLKLLYFQGLDTAASVCLEVTLLATTSSSKPLGI